MLSRIYETEGICLSAAAHHCGGFAVVGLAGRRYQSIAALSCNCEQCHIGS